MAVRLALLGPPGSGKGTQGARLREKYGIPHISSGDLLREAVKEGSDLGRRAKSYMETGELVPDSVVTELIIERIRRSDCATGFLLDGFPRTVEQAHALAAMLAEADMALDRVIALVVPEDEVVERLGGRRGCPSCGALYHVSFSPPKTAGICDECGTALNMRDDDQEDTIRQRLEVYRKQTAPVISFYDDCGLLVSIEGTGAPASVAERVEGATP